MFELTEDMDEKNVLVFANDIHLGAPPPHDELQRDYIVLVDLLDRFKYVVLGGDVVDRSNCRESEIDMWTAIMMRLRNIFCFDYVLGNHECTNKFNYLTMKTINNKKVVCLHGQGAYIFNEWYPVYYSEERNKKWTHKKYSKLGRGKLSYWAYGFKRKYLSKHKGGWREPSEEIKERLYRIGEIFDADVIVWGHSHKEYDGNYRGVRLVNCPKGINYLQI